MGAFAYIGIFDAVAKLAIAYLLLVIGYDHLIVYSILLLLVGIISNLLLYYICSYSFYRVYNELFFG